MNDNDLSKQKELYAEHHIASLELAETKEAVVQAVMDDDPKLPIVLARLNLASVNYNGNLSAARNHYSANEEEYKIDAEKDANADGVEINHQEIF